MVAYDEALPLREARAAYFEANGFGADGGYGARWVKLRLGPIPVAFPNLESRRRAVRIHDLHHVLTGYETSATGEAEIAAWEIASGCGRYTAAWVLNLWGMAYGIWLAPRALLRAFARGRRSRNLYRDGLDDAYLDTPVGPARAALGIPDHVTVGAGDRFAFVGWSGLAVLFGFATLAIGLLPPCLLVLVMS